ncbi:protein Iojap-related, mitochondrial [Diospyros lotus]|uniref:protein Iojap-related, mitochondrial n=1 Tax=Diospyros lotus TaxID=55363 RepID=UPI0022536BB3|nr:protein Iojap-related, mitochondrial [Diospyros lotus]
MWAALRSRALPISSSSPTYSSSLASAIDRWKLGIFGSSYRSLCSSLVETGNKKGLLQLDEVQKVLGDVKADNVQVVPVRDQCDWTDFMVFVTGRSAWHVRNIARALIYKAKQKQRGAERMLLPSVEGEKEGKWIVIDSGTIIIHALDEKARSYYNLERLWRTETSSKDRTQDLEKAFLKVRPKNNSKKRAPTGA